MRVEVLGETVVVAPGRRFTKLDVEELELRLRFILPIEALVVDFSRAREVEDAALARLPDVLRRLARSVEFRGLGIHHRRLLRYLGRTAPDGPVTASSVS